VTQSGYAAGVLVTHQMARPIKIEGNPDHPASLGAASAIMQASILQLYDPRRAQTLTGKGQIATWESLVAELYARRTNLLAKNGDGLRILTGAVTSPLLAAQLAALQQQFPNLRWHQWEPLHRDNELAAAQTSFGQPAERIFDLSKAERIVAIESDLISATPGWLAYARQFAAARRPVETGGTMSRIYAIESTPTLLGAKADHRLPLRPDEVARSMRYLAGAVGAGPQEWTAQDNLPLPWLQAAADDLKQNKGKALVHVGREQPAELHVLADAINGELGAFGNPVRLIAPVTFGEGAKQQSIAELAGDMRAGKVDTLLILGANPVYDAPADLNFADALKRVPSSLALSLYDDETALACTWRVPATHEYEMWSDARAFDGTITIQQPQARPLYGGRSPHQVLAILLGSATTDDYTLTRDYWQKRAQQENRGDFDTFWHEALRAGVVPDTAAHALAIIPKAGIAAEIGTAPAHQSRALQALFRPDDGNWDGRYADNPWLLEMARPLTRLTWDNAALIAPGTAQRLDLKTNDVVEMIVGGTTLKAPVFVLAGQSADCVTLPLGWGRTAGGLGAGAGFDAYRVRRADTPWNANISSIRKTGETYKLASVQGQDRILGRDLLHEGTLQQFADNPHFLNKKSEPDSLYPPFEYPDRAWAMTIDLNSCIGCQACTIACQAENNVPIVGREQVLAQRVMHWLRIDRYYSGSPDNPDTAFEPIPCMHCENAPCEVVCPVHATVTDHEGLNLMIYNRCVGTRFCSNNCPYKVRRFNFYAFAQQNERPDASWNPDVSVRDRGVMEKCTYCIQRIRKTQIEAAKEDRPIRDGEIVTACQQSCPTQAIVFGDRNDRQSTVVKRKSSPLDYVLLEELNTRPRTSYGALIRNPNPAIKGGPS
jgi:molybdopterin-containing oxidoreductase family iron-sulfur binding subunit